MVQMKARLFWSITGISTLYIPHGSDERAGTASGSIYVSGLYIPHGSDESIYRD